VLAVGACGQTLEQAQQAAYRLLADIRFDGMYYRKDIGNDLLWYLSNT